LADDHAGLRGLLFPRRGDRPEVAAEVLAREVLVERRRLQARHRPPRVKGRPRMGSPTRRVEAGCCARDFGGPGMLCTVSVTCVEYATLDHVAAHISPEPTEIHTVVSSDRQRPSPPPPPPAGGLKGERVLPGDRPHARPRNGQRIPIVFPTTAEGSVLFGEIADRRGDPMRSRCHGGMRRRILTMNGRDAEKK